MAPTLKGKWFVIPVLIAAVVIGLGIWFYRDFYRMRKFHIVEDGVVFRCATQTGDLSQRRLFENTKAKTVVILRTEEEKQKGDWWERESRIAAEYGVELIWLHMDYDKAPTPEQIRRFLEIVDDPARQPVIFHCEVGVIRTGMMAAAYRLERSGWSNAEALKEYEQIAGGHAQNPDRAGLKEWILNYRPQFPRPKTEEARAP